jgi:hypothetical protein
LNCDKTKDLFSEAIDGAMSPVEARDFETHLAGCPPCRVAFGDLKDALSVLGELPSIDVGPEFDDAVWRRLRAEQRAGEQPGVTLGERVREWVGGLRLGSSWRWAPLGAAAAILGWVALSSDQAALPGTSREKGASGGLVRVESTVPDTETLLRNPDFIPVEFTAGMPKAVEEFISRGEDLTPRYRQSNYNYPFRPVSDPIVVPMPVSTGAAPIETPTPSSSSTETGVSVLAF